ncbi:SEC-C metal-binding domain-containing protein [uncultured Cyclobacterium sp.]|uniref:SEC-C metal-binding domain-containing protein n=1 Tax=uncultured Cyclobacterium sp. TaxID=453820 RepID=UPI0030EF3472
MPAYCDNCRIYFNSPIKVGEGIRNITFQNVSATCPNCHRQGRVRNGVYNILKNGIELISSSDINIQRLKALNEIFTNAQKTNPSIEEFKATLKNETPELQKLSDALPKTRGELYQFLGLLIALISLLTSLCESGEVKNININNVINHYNNTYIIKKKPETRTINEQPKKKKTRPNDKCHCGSGIKYKRCHGKIKNI